MHNRNPASGTRLGVALLRVSTDRQFQEGESIETQRRKTEFVARRERIDIVRFFTEHYSGRKRQLDDMVILAHIRAQFSASNESYGSPLHGAAAHARQWSQSPAAAAFSQDDGQ